MSLKQEIKDLEAQRDEALEREASDVEEEVVEEKAVDGVTDDVVVEEKPTEEEKLKEEEVKAEEKLDDAGYARLRRERAAEKRRADELAEENARLKASPKEDEGEGEAGNANLQVLDSIIREHNKTQAEREFISYEAEARRTLPDMDAVSAEYAQAIQGAIKIQNPRLSNIQIAEMTKQVMLQKAGAFLRDGFSNPVEELYHEAKELGFTGKSMVKEEKAKDPKPDMAKVAENRKRSAGMTGAPGKEDGLITKATAAQFTPLEWKKLDRVEKERILAL